METFKVIKRFIRYLIKKIMTFYCKNELKKCHRIKLQNFHFSNRKTSSRM